MTDHRQLDTWVIHRNSFAYGRLVAQGKGLQIWCCNEELEYLDETDKESYKLRDDAKLTYVLLKVNKLTGKHFDSDSMLKNKFVIGYIQVARNKFPLRKCDLSKINGRYIVKHDNKNYLKASEIVLSYVVEKYRHGGFGRFLYRWVLYSEKVLQTGYCLHCTKGKINGSLGIWKNWLTKKYNPCVWNKTTRRIREYKSSERIIWRTSYQSILVACGKILK